MRRAIALFLAHFLVGSLITIAIAWGCAYWATFSGHWWSGVAAEEVDGEVWSVRYSDQGLIYIYMSWWMDEERLRSGFIVQDRGRPRDVLPWWVPVPRTPPERRAGATRFDTVTAAGWPWPAMYYRHVDIGPLNANNATVSGAIRLTSPSRSSRTQLQYLPLYPLWPWFYLESAIIGGLLFGGLVLYRANLGVRRRMFGRCPTCAYDLRGDLKSGCPECGWNRCGRTAS